jgi:DNA-binding NarL/FixJ family response regulator
MAASPHAQNGLVLVIDEKPLRRSMLAVYLDRLGYVGARAVASADEGDKSLASADESPALVIVSIGAGRLDCEGPTRALVQQAGQTFPATPLVLISDIDTRSQVVAALALGVRGFIHTDVSAEVMSLSLQLVQFGGSVAPTRPFLESAHGGDGLNDAEPTAKKKRADHPTVNASNGAHDLEDLVALVCEQEPDLADQNLPHFSPRQLEVLRLIRSGAQNKHIAYRLNMREGTVKVHVRNIFRKLSVTNRTQAAFVTAQQLSNQSGRV